MPQAAEKHTQTKQTENKSVVARNGQAEMIVKSCPACQLNSSPPPQVQTVRTQLPAKPWQTLAINLCGPFPSGEHLFMVTDYYSGWVEVTVLTSITSANMIKAVRKIFLVHGLPECIMTHNDAPLIASEFKVYVREIGIEHQHITPYWP